MARTWSTLAGLAALLLATGCTPASKSSRLAGDPASPGMRDLTGAACQAYARDDIAPDPAAPAPIYLFCGPKDRPIGAVSAIALPLSLPVDEAARHEALVKTAAVSAAGRDAATRMGCQDGTWTKTADGLDLLIKPCTLFDGGWPQVVVIGAVGRYLLQAEGLPAMMPVLETAMANMVAYKPADGAPAFGGTDAARGLLERALGSDLRMIGAADYARFSELTETARLNSSRKNFRAAEDAYREALTIQERAFGPTSPSIGSTLMSLALEVSNQGRFDESAAVDLAETFKGGIAPSGQLTD